VPVPNLITYSDVEFLSQKASRERIPSEILNLVDLFEVSKSQIDQI